MRSIVADAVRQAIMEGELQPGERIVERKLAAQFEASLSVIREALVQLETEGFIVKRRNTATHVIQFTLEDAAKMFDFRAVLEPYAMAEAAKRAKPADVRELRAIHTRMRERAKAKDLSGYLREDYAWHDRIWQLAGNEYVRTSLARVIGPASAFFAIRCSGAAFDMVEDARGHLKILEAIAANDATAAGTITRTAMAEWRSRPALYAGPAPQPE